MKQLAIALCDYLLDTYGDLGFVTPAAFANALRTVGKIPEGASPLFMEQWIADHGITVRVNAAPESIAGFNYSLEGRGVIETGKNRSIEERNITIPHEFGERLQVEMNAELGRRGIAPIDWPDHAWDTMSVEIVSPLAAFRHMAQQNGIDLMDLAKPLSYEAVVRHVKDAFDGTLPLFAMYYRNDSKWERGRGFVGETWTVAQASWTKMWFTHGYRQREEVLRIPRRGSRLREDSLIDRVRRSGRAMLIHAHHRTDNGALETEILVRPRSYGRDVAQVFAVGIAKKFGHVLDPQIRLVGPDERTAAFAEVM